MIALTLIHVDVRLKIRSIIWYGTLPISFVASKWKRNIGICMIIDFYVPLRYFHMKGNVKTRLKGVIGHPS